MMTVTRAIRRATALLLPVLALSTVVDTADAQYFGQNVVQYRTFDFRVLRTDNFDVYFYPEEADAARDAARMAERWYERLSRILDHRFEERQPLVFYGSHPAFQQTTTIGGAIGEGTGGVTESAKQRVIMPLTGSYQETDHVLGHELVHAFQYDMSGLGRSRGTVTQAGRALGTAPLWFIEGMAEYLSVGPFDPNTAMWVRDAALSGNLPTIEQLTFDPRVFPYRWGHALWAYVGGRWGDAAIGQILRLVGQGVAYPDAMQRVLNITLDELVEDWHVAIRRSYLPMLAERPEAREIAEPLITRTDGAQLNVGPAISPDGQWVAFLSSLELDVELWLANAHTGEVVRRLRRGAAFDPHFESLRYINSAGSWAPDSRRFVFSALRGGRDRLVILDTNNARRLEEITIPGVTEITTPSWSPDGRTIVFSGIVGGVSDLYAHDVESGETRQLTDDLWANLHPNVSPDGGSVAFVTDQLPDNDLGTLRVNGYGIAVLDLGTGQSRLVTTVATEASNMNPEWTRDGNGLFFVSDRSGIPNVYRIDLASGDLFQVTDLFGGVSGITQTSPAITVARDIDRLLFTAFEENGYNVYALGTAEELAGTPVTGEALAATWPPETAALPPTPRPTEAAFNRVSAYLGDPLTGLPSAATVAQWEVDPYSPRITLDFLGQPTVGVTTGGVMGQGGLYGGIAAVFSDMLGYHTIFGAVQAQGEFDEIGFSTVYLNRKHRWNYGASAQRIPYVQLARNMEFEPMEDLGGGAVGGILHDQIIRLRLFNTALHGVTQYPFSAAQRAEFSGGVRRIARDAQVIDVSGPAVVQDGRILQFQPQEQDRFELEGFSESYNLAEASAALVYDNALFGFTSPFAGQRYRFEVSPSFGSLNFLQALGDYRRYLFWQPFTFAVQGLHFGRYGTDADEGIFQEIFLGQPSLVRGYWGVYSECASGSLECEPGVMDQLFGSRIGVAKAELRFPLIRQLVVGPGLGFPPIEGYVFGDAGLAWRGGNDVNFSRFPGEVPLQQDPTTGRLVSTDRYLLTSTGVGARANLFGYVIVEINYVNAHQRDRGWHWQFALQPGF